MLSVLSLHIDYGAEKNKGSALLLLLMLSWIEGCVCISMEGKITRLLAIGLEEATTNAF